MLFAWDSVCESQLTQDPFQKWDPFPGLKTSVYVADPMWIWVDPYPYLFRNAGIQTPWIQ